ncbi:putative nucleotidyltransferase [Methanocella conradii HZ254]|uniref:Nucleotidyltransferase n=1 Tax=Methanocella conradii (strain DSM 24694 / JCM 17849 / CGMCC 1.5162 / HZ254) TaxID=1041930 RepID=H8I909_METCZ|nr:nucleotidyltransferase domain-containing protein [Methanocella conradii]AFC99012.1 putative nucleotidyltransferase [Methanocella conradii HZ254]MDI6896743.1 nucleotidyltransferase domain-containing protein [Methanocella conradii]
MASHDLSLIDLIASDGCIQLLKPFLYKPGIEMYQSEVIRVTRIPKTRAIRLLNSLSGYGLLNEKVKAGSKFYSISEGNPVLKQLKILIILSKLYELVRDFSDKNIEIYLFGSAARGEDTENSDIDLLIIADTDKSVLNELIERLKTNMEREVNPIVYTPIGYANLYNTEKAFYESIERYKIRVL